MKFSLIALFALMMVVVVVHSEDMMPSEDILKHFLKKLTKWTKKCDKKHGGCFDDDYGYAPSHYGGYGQSYGHASYPTYGQGYGHASYPSYGQSYGHASYPSYASSYGHIASPYY